MANTKRPHLKLILLIFVFLAAFAPICHAQDVEVLKHPVTRLTAQGNYDRIRDVLRSSPTLYYPDGGISVQEKKAFLEKFIAGEGFKVINFAHAIQNHDDEAAQNLKKCSKSYNSRETSHVLWNGTTNFYGPYYGPFVVYEIEDGGYYVIEKLNNVPLSQTNKFPDKDIIKQYRSHGLAVVKLPIKEYSCSPLENVPLAVCSGETACKYNTYSGLLKNSNNYYFYFLVDTGINPDRFDLIVYILKFDRVDDMIMYHYHGVYGDID